VLFRCGNREKTGSRPSHVEQTRGNGNSVLCDPTIARTLSGAVGILIGPVSRRRRNHTVVLPAALMRGGRACSEPGCGHEKCYGCYGVRQGEGGEGGSQSAGDRLTVDSNVVRPSTHTSMGFQRSRLGEDSSVRARRAGARFEDGRVMTGHLE